MQLQPSFTALALRAWWPVVVVLAVIGFGVGMYSVGVASYSATALLRVDVSTNPLQSKEIISTSQILVDSDPVYFRATNGTREAADALRARTSVGIVNDGEVLKVTVVAPTAAAATTQTNKMADAAVVQAQALSVDQFNRVTQLAQDSLKNGSLADVDSEKQRREHVGQNLADAQSAASRSSDLLTRIGGVQAPVAMGLPPRLAGPLGALIGALLGFAASLLLGVRRNRVRRPADLKVVDPRLRVYGPDDIDNGLMRVAARCATLDRPLVAVLALPAAENSLPMVLERFDRHLRNESLRRIDIDAEDLGRGTAVVDRASPTRSGGESVGLPARMERGPILEAAKADVIVVSGSAGPRVAHEAGARAEAVIVVGKLQASRLKEFFTLYPEISDSSPMVLLVRSDSKQASTPDDGVEDAAATEDFGAETAGELPPADHNLPDYQPEETTELLPADHGLSAYRPESVAVVPVGDTDRVLVPVSVSTATGPTSFKGNGNGNGSSNGNGNGSSNGRGASGNGNAGVSGSGGGGNGGANGNGTAGANGNGTAGANGNGTVDGNSAGDGSGDGSSRVDDAAAEPPAPERPEGSLVDLVRATASASAAAPAAPAAEHAEHSEGSLVDMVSTNPPTAAPDRPQPVGALPSPSPRPRPAPRPESAPEDQSSDGSEDKNSDEHPASD